MGGSIIIPGSQLKHEGTRSTNSKSESPLAGLIENYKKTSDILTPRIPMRQSGAYRPLRSDCSRLRRRRKSWIESEFRAAIFQLEKLLISKHNSEDNFKLGLNKGILGLFVFLSSQITENRDKIG